MTISCQDSPVNKKHIDLQNVGKERFLATERFHPEDMK